MVERVRTAAADAYLVVASIPKNAYPCRDDADGPTLVKSPTSVTASPVCIALAEFGLYAEPG